MNEIKYFSICAKVLYSFKINLTLCLWMMLKIETILFLCASFPTCQTCNVILKSLLKKNPNMFIFQTNKRIKIYFIKKKRRKKFKFWLKNYRRKTTSYNVNYFIKLKYFCPKARKGTIKFMNLLTYLFNSVRWIHTYTYIPRL